MISRILLKDIPKVVSFLLHPLLMPLIGLLILFNSGTYFSFFPFEYKRSIFLIVGICTLGVPLVFIPIYFYRNVIKSVEMNESQERIIPLLVTAGLFYLSYHMLINSAVPRALQVFLLGATFNVIVTLLITLKWKISAHMIGLGGIVGLIVSISIIFHSNVIAYLILFIILSGIVGTARLLLNSHSPAQVYSGFIVGFVVMFFTLFIF